MFRSCISKEDFEIVHSLFVAYAITHLHSLLGTGTSIKYVGIKIVHNTVLSSFLTYDWVCNKSNTTDATGGAGTIYTSDVRPRFLVRFVVLDVFFVVFRRALLLYFLSLVLRLLITHWYIIQTLINCPNLPSQ